MNSRYKNLRIPQLLLLMLLLALITAFGSGSVRGAFSEAERSSTTSRQQQLPTITLEVDQTEIAAGLNPLNFTLRRSGNVDDELDVTLNIVQSQDWLTTTSFDLAFAAGSDEVAQRVRSSSFSRGSLTDGTLTASVAEVAGYDVTGATATVDVKTIQGALVRVGLNHLTYTVSESAGTLSVELVALAAQGVPNVPTFSVSLSTKRDSAVPADEEVGIAGDYERFSLNISFPGESFTEEGGRLVAKVTQDVTIYDDIVHEGNEQFGLLLQARPGLNATIFLVTRDGENCRLDCSEPYPVTITDNDVEPVLRLNLDKRALSETDDSGEGVRVTIESTTGTAYASDRIFTFSVTGSAIRDRDCSLLLEDDDDDTAADQAKLAAGSTSLEAPLSVIDDSIHDPCEWFSVWAISDQPDAQYLHSGVVTIKDNDDDAPIETSLRVGLQHELTGELTRSDDGRDWFTFNADLRNLYIIELKRPLAFTGPPVPASGGDAILLEGSLVDPSMLEITDHLGTQVLGEHDQGGFSLNFARVFFDPPMDGAYRIAVGAGPQDRTAFGCYTISLRIDAQADDYRTSPNSMLEPGQTTNGYIDSDANPQSPRIHPWDWTNMGSDTLPRPGIESLDDRDVFRIEIPEDGRYRFVVGTAPDGVGVWYVWDESGNRYIDTTGTPQPRLVDFFEAGAYYVEVGTPYDSSGATGYYLVSLEAVTSRR